MASNASFSIITADAYRKFLLSDEGKDLLAKASGVSLEEKDQFVGYVKQMRNAPQELRKKARFFGVSDDHDEENPTVLDMVQTKTGNRTVPHECVHAVVVFKLPRYLFENHRDGLKKNRKETIQQLYRYLSEEYFFERELLKVIIVRHGETPTVPENFDQVEEHERKNPLEELLRQCRPVTEVQQQNQLQLALANNRGALLDLPQANNIVPSSLQMPMLGVNAGLQSNLFGSYLPFLNSAVARNPMQPTLIQINQYCGENHSYIGENSSSYHPSNALAYTNEAYEAETNSEQPNGRIGDLPAALLETKFNTMLNTQKDVLKGIHVLKANQNALMEGKTVEDTENIDALAAATQQVTLTERTEEDTENIDVLAVRKTEENAPTERTLEKILHDLRWSTNTSDDREDEDGTSTGGFSFDSDDEDTIHRVMPSYCEANKLESGLLVFELYPCGAVVYSNQGEWQQLYAKEQIALRFVRRHDGAVEVQHFSKDKEQVLYSGLLVWVNKNGHVVQNNEQEGHAAHLYDPNKPHPLDGYSNDGGMVVVRSTTVGSKGLAKEPAHMFWFWDPDAPDAALQLIRSSLKDVEILQKNWHRASVLRRQANGM